MSEPKGMFQCRQVRDQVFLHFEGKATATVAWQAALDIYFAIKRSVRHLIEDKAHAKFMLDGHELHLVMEPAVLVQIGVAICQTARLAEEYATAAQVAFDSALLLRAGAGFTLTDDPKINDMAAVELVHNHTLRGALPMPSIPSRAVFGAPSIVQGEPQ